MDTNTVESTFSQAQAVPAVEPTVIGDFVIDPQIVVLEFEHNTKPGSTFRGTAIVEITGLIPGCTVGMAKIGYFGPMDEDNPDDRGRCKFLNYKNGEDKWKPSFWLTDTATGKLTTNYKLLARIRKAVETFLEGKQSPTQKFDELPQDIEVTNEDIPF
jgi:hypothetical protein